MKLRYFLHFCCNYDKTACFQTEIINHLNELTKIYFFISEVSRMVVIEG